MPEFGSFARLQRRLASHELGLHKPDPAIYQAATRTLGAAPGEILFFDDLAHNVSAAREAGWAAEWIDPAGDPVGQMRAHLASLGVLGGASGGP